MTREEAKALAPIMQAYADSKPVQWLNDKGVWEDTLPAEQLGFTSNAERYRIKPEPRVCYVSFHVSGFPQDVWQTEDAAKDAARRINGTWAEFVEVVK